MKQWIDLHKKLQEGLLYENDAGKKIISTSKSYEHFSEVMLHVNDL